MIFAILNEHLYTPVSFLIIVFVYVYFSTLVVFSFLILFKIKFSVFFSGPVRHCVQVTSGGKNCASYLIQRSQTNLKRHSMIRGTKITSRELCAEK